MMRCAACGHENRGAAKMFTDLAREVTPVNPDLGKLAEVGARHGLKVAV